MKKINQKRKCWRLIRNCAAGGIGVVILLVVLRQTGVWIPNALFVRNSVVRGADVSAYQGTIDWKRLSSQPIRFVFLKATEGAGFQDKQFARNWEQARQSGLVVGAYHFFNFDVPASEQAENFIRTVPVQTGALPPTVDVEFYGRFNQNHPAREKVRPMLDTLLTALEEHYGKKPMLYCTESAYHAYLTGAYVQNPVWIRNVWLKPSVPANWTFWQYTDKGRLDGTNGTEQFVDLNVFCGGEQAFQQFVSG